MVCIDTDIIIQYLKGEEKADKKINELIEKDELTTTTSINVFELYKGGRASSEELEIISNFLSYFSVYDFDIKASKKSAEIFNSLKKQGKEIDPLDLMIASIAITKNQKLLTGNIKHFNRLSDLELEPY